MINTFDRITANQNKSMIFEEKKMGKRNKVTTRDIAEYAGVSQSTVSMILSEKKNVSFGEETVDKGKKAAK